jgi:hypothetical protein
MDLVSDLRARRRRGVGISANYDEDVEGIREFRISSECIGVFEFQGQADGQTLVEGA